MAFQKRLLLQAVAVAAAVDALLYALLPRLMELHSIATGALLQLAQVPWRNGMTVTLLPGITASLIHTTFLDYAAHPWYQVSFTAVVIPGAVVGFKRLPGPLKPLAVTVPAVLLASLFYLRFVSPQMPYSPEQFCAIWYRGEAYLWLLIPVLFALGFFVLDVPFALKVRWLCLLLGYSYIWSVVRLAFGLATFHHFGSLWMPLYYLLFGFLADFLYIVAIYSLAMDRAAAFLARQQEAWQ